MKVKKKAIRRISPVASLGSTDICDYHQGEEPYSRDVRTKRVVSDVSGVGPSLDSVSKKSVVLRLLPVMFVLVAVLDNSQPQRALKNVMLLVSVTNVVVQMACCRINILRVSCFLTLSKGLVMVHILTII